MVNKFNFLKYISGFIVLLFFPCLFQSVVFANNVLVSNVSLAEQDIASKTAKIIFDISWSNSWNNNTNHDAAWVFVKYSKDSGSSWSHATLKTSGTNPAGTSIGTGTGLDIIIPSDRKGAFLKRSSPGIGSVSTTTLKLVWDWDADGLLASDTVRVRVFTVEMVYIPAGSFYAGDNATSSASLKQGSADADPWQITSESAISVSGAANNGFYYVSGANTGENSTGSVFTIPAGFPKGYSTFYVMKYEISEGQWIDFFNTLPDEAKANHDTTSVSGKNSDDVINRNTVSWTSGNAVSARQNRAESYLSWMDLCAYADWAGLRPMSELEYEKICRGPKAAVSGEYAWGNASLVVPSSSGISGAENGTETITTVGANSLYGSVNFSSGDGGTGPLRCGIFATGTSNRTTAGAAYYGVMDLSGNLWERVVTIGNSQGRNFTGTHGDGLLTTASGYEGFASNSDWPGIDPTPANGITGSTGSGFRGGNWNVSSGYLRASDRSKAALTSNIRASDYGGRCVRTAS